MASWTGLLVWTRALAPRPPRNATAVRTADVRTTNAASTGVGRALHWVVVGCVFMPADCGGLPLEHGRGSPAPRGQEAGSTVHLSGVLPNCCVAVAATGRVTQPPCGPG